MASQSNQRSGHLGDVQNLQPVQAEAENVNPELPLEEEADILGRRTLPELASLCVSKSRAVRTVLDEKHPKMIAFVGIEHPGFRLTVAAFDFASGQWHYRVLDHLLDDHRRLRTGYVHEACFAHDAGLLCFVIPRSPIVVCSVLTGEWKALEPFEECKQMDPVLVQLVVDHPTCHYKVTVVYQYVKAVVYDSQTKLWSTMEGGGVVYGQKVVYCPRDFRKAEYFSCGYNCESGEWFQPELQSHLGSLYPGVSEANFVTAKQRMFKVKQELGEERYRISESVADNNTGGVREVDSYNGWLPVMANYHGLYLTATDRFLLTVEDHWVRVGVRFHKQQTMRVRDELTGEWHEIPMPMGQFTIPTIDNFFMCELRWNAIP